MLAAGILLVVDEDQSRAAPASLVRERVLQDKMLLVGAVLLIADVTDFERGALGRLLCAPAEGLLHLGILVMPHEFLVQLDLLVGVGVVRNLDLNVALAVARERTADIAQNRASVKGHFLRSSFYHHTHLLVLLLVDIVNSTLLATGCRERRLGGLAWMP